LFLSNLKFSNRRLSHPKKYETPCYLTFELYDNTVVCHSTPAFKVKLLENRGQVVAERRATEMETRYISFGTWELVGQTNEECNNNMLRGNK